MWRIRELAEKVTRLPLVSFISKVQIQRVDTGKKGPCHDTTVHMHACTFVHTCQHAHALTHTFFGDFFFSLSFLFSFLHRLRQRWTMSLRRMSDSSIQVMLPRHIPMCCPTAESSYGFEPKQGVAIPLPACPLLSARCSTVEELGFKWTGGV